MPITKQCKACFQDFDVPPSCRSQRYCSLACRADIDAKYIPEPMSGCWIWLGARNRKGYGNYQGFMAHREVYKRHVGKIPEGLQLDHLCRNPAYVNPDHLEPVTNLENGLRGPRIKRARAATHCRHGHPWTSKNTYIHPTSGSRVCRVCTLDSVCRYQQRREN